MTTNNQSLQVVTCWRQALGSSASATLSAIDAFDWKRCKERQMTKNVIVAAMAALAVSAATTLPAMTDYGSPRYGMGSWAAPMCSPANPSMSAEIPSALQVPAARRSGSCRTSSAVEDGSGHRRLAGSGAPTALPDHPGAARPTALHRAAAGPPVRYADRAEARAPS